ncbi:MAG: efflux RND transporter periplasmic adaptor subunit [Anderseniella sp.]
MRISNIPTAVLALSAALSVSGCEEEQLEVVPQIRAIKTYTVTEVASGQSRKFSGQVYATDSATLSFHVNGKVTEMSAKQGDRVEKDQVLAVVDKQPYDLDVQSAKAELEKARANLTRARQEFERQETLYKKGWVAKKALDGVRAQFDSGRSQLDFATSKLNLAKRDLRLTELKAPYLGSISRKHIDAFTEVKTGQPIYDIEASGALEVRFDISETIISRVSLGMLATIKFPTSEGTILRARITEIGSSAGTANAFPVKASLNDPPDGIRSGMTAEATILLKEEGTESGFLVPLAAIAAADQAGQGYAFIYDPATQTVKKSLVKAKGATDNFVHVYEGIKAGDIVAVAGVTFLSDGQKVKLMQQRTSDALGTSGAAQ